jgi:hypothetical protein
MKVFHRILLFAALLAPPLLLGLTGKHAGHCSGAPGDATVGIAAAQQFYTRALGDWVGSTVTRVNSTEPATGYFHLVVTRVDANTFREEYTFYRLVPKTDVMEPSGTQSYLTTIESSGVIHRTYRGSGTILIDFKPKKQSFDASGEVRFTSPNHLEAAAKGKITVDGMPLGLGKNGKLQKATSTFSLEDDKLIGEMHFEASFRVLLFSKRYRIETQLRGQRGANVQIVAGRVPAP